MWKAENITEFVRRINLKITIDFKYQLGKTAANLIASKSGWLPSVVWISEIQLYDLIITQFYSQKKSSIELTVWVLLVWMALFTLFYCLGFSPPTNRGLYLVGGGGGVRGWVVGVLPRKIFRCLKMVFLLIFYFKQVQLIGGTIFFLDPTRQY